jgi:hypothetical protein
VAGVATGVVAVAEVVLAAVAVEEGAVLVAEVVAGVAVEPHVAC